MSKRPKLLQCESCGKSPVVSSDAKHEAEVEERTIQAVIDWLIEQAGGDPNAWDTLERVAEELANGTWKKVGAR